MPQSEPSTALAFALAYASVGLRVLPIKPGSKRPPMDRWGEAATTDTEIVTNWYSGMYADHGVGLAMGRQPDGRFVFALDVDEHDVAHSGVETLSDLQAANSRLPDTVCSITGSGGLHLLFTAPTGVEVRNGIAGDGLDVRGEGGQIVVAPTVHPVTHRRYEWEDTFAPWEREIAEAPNWLLDLVRLASVGPSPPSTPTLDFNQPDSPAEWLRSWWQWPVELRRAGWTEHHTNRNGDMLWTRPGKERREGESAILHPDGAFIVFSTDASMAGLHNIGHLNRDGSVTVSPFEFFAAYEHHGDESAAARFLLSKMDPVDRRLSAPAPGEPTDLDGYAAQVLDWPAFWKDDHSGESWAAEPLIPAGRLTVLYAPAKQGKSEVALTVVAAVATGRSILGQRNNRGPRHVVYLDYEMTKDDLAERLEQLGYGEDDDLSHLHYYLLPSLPPLDTPQGAAVVRWIAAHHDAEVVVIDTMGRAVEGDENSNDTYRAFARNTGIALKSDGVAVVRTDHAGKAREKGQRGASAKNDDADVVFRVDRIDSGWRLTRTHTRVGWVPETVLIDRATTSDKRLRIELAPDSKPTYPTGTRQYAEALINAGIAVDRTTTKRDLTAAAKAVSLSKSGELIGAALKFIKNEMLNQPVQVSPGGSPAPSTHPGGDRPGDGNVEGVSGPDSRLSADSGLDLEHPW